MTQEADADLTERLLREERLRASIAAELAKDRVSPRPWLSDSVKWIIVSIMIPLVTAIHGHYENRSADIKARADREIAEARQAQEAVLADARNDVTAMTALLPALSDPDLGKSELALVVLGRLEAAQHGPDNAPARAIYTTIREKIDARRDSGNVKDANLGARQLEALLNAKGNTQQLQATPAAQPVKSAGGITPLRPERVYIQVFTEDQRAAAARVQEGLRNLGVAVPGIENVGAKLAKGTLPKWQIRYFADADLGAATWTQAELARLGFNEFKIFRAYAKTPTSPGQIEVWWPNSRDR